MDGGGAKWLLNRVFLPARAPALMAFKMADRERERESYSADYSIMIDYILVNN